jgi:hypothetical protein
MLGRGFQTMMSFKPSGIALRASAWCGCRRDKDRVINEENEWLGGDVLGRRGAIPGRRTPSRGFLGVHVHPELGERATGAAVRATLLPGTAPLLPN